MFLLLLLPRSSIGDPHTVAHWQGILRLRMLRGRSLGEVAAAAGPPRRGAFATIGSFAAPASRRAHQTPPALHLRRRAAAVTAAGGGDGPTAASAAAADAGAPAAGDAELRAFLEGEAGLKVSGAASESVRLWGRRRGRRPHSARPPPQKPTRAQNPTPTHTRAQNTHTRTLQHLSLPSPTRRTVSSGSSPGALPPPT